MDENFIIQWQQTEKAIMDIIQSWIPFIRQVAKALGISTRKPKKRSSRRLAVQAKRKRLGLTVDGKMPENRSGHRFTRKQSYFLASKSLSI